MAPLLMGPRPNPEANSCDPSVSLEIPQGTPGAVGDRRLPGSGRNTQDSSCLFVQPPEALDPGLYSQARLCLQRQRAQSTQLTRRQLGLGGGNGEAGPSSGTALGSSKSVLHNFYFLQWIA